MRYCDARLLYVAVQLDHETTLPWYLQRSNLLAYSILGYYASFLFSFRLHWHGRLRKLSQLQLL